MNGSEDPELLLVAEEHQKDVQQFLDAYIEVLTMIGGQEMVKRMQQEVKHVTSQGTGLGVALSQHYLSFKKEFGL